VNPYDLIEVPDGIERMVGYRGWLVKDDKLLSCYRQVEWPQTGYLTAECISPTFGAINDRGGSLAPPRKHWNPIKECTCGIYALSEFPEEWGGGNRKDTVVKPWPNEAVVGVIEGWGHMVVGDRGFRAQYAKPVALVSMRRNGEWPEVVVSLSEMYGIDVADAREVREHGYRRAAQRDLD
jgi:hypothetical protein